MMSKKKKERGIILAAFDVETEGLNGKITKIGFTINGKDVIETTPETFMEELNKISKEQDKNIHIYAHNLDFDFAKIAKAENLHLADNRPVPLFIMSSVVRARFEEYPNIIFHDSYKLVPSSLGKISKDYGLESGKLEINYKDLGYKSKEEYFKHAAKTDPENFQKYWENDVKAVYQLLEIIMKENGITEKELVSCPTAPSLSMKIYKKKCPEMAKLITNCKNLQAHEEFIRMGYVGGRTEVFKPLFEGGENDFAYHYDVNSLYPFVMEKYSYPIGKPAFIIDGEMIEETYNEVKKGEGLYKAGMIHCKVYVPENINIPVLPYRTEEKLLFPTGIFTGVWCHPELEEAERLGCKILEFYGGMFWRETEYIFKDIINQWSQIKMNSTGARRENVKLLQNSLYGKFGMNRQKKGYKKYNRLEYKKMKDKNINCATVYLGNEKWIEYEKRLYADYIHPEISAFITCYARLWLFRGIRIAQDMQANIYYCDTDSLVIDKKLPSNEVDGKIYGKYKLEEEIIRGVFIQPKLYAELTKDGKFIPKSKGLIRQKREELTYESYLNFYQAAVNKARIELYKNVEGRYKYLSALKKGVDLDKPYLQSKAIDFSKPQKREMIFDNNISKPVHVKDGKWFGRNCNKFLWMGASLYGELYAREKAYDYWDKGIKTSLEQRYTWKEEGMLLYLGKCGIISREKIKLKEREKITS